MALLAAAALLIGGVLRADPVLVYGSVAEVSSMTCNESRSAWMAIVRDGASSSDCTTGGGSYRVHCYCSGTAWTPEPGIAESATLAGDVDGGAGATDLDEAAVETELEAVLDLAELQGAVTDAQVPDTITVDLATTAATANAGDSATAFFSTGTIEPARLPADDDVPEAGDFAALALTGGVTSTGLTTTVVDDSHSHTAGTLPPDDDAPDSDAEVPDAITVNPPSGVSGGTASRCARFDGGGSLVAASGDCAAGDTTGGGGGGNYVSVDVDFGAAGSTGAAAVVTGQAWVGASSLIVCAPTMLATASRAEGAEDALVEGLAAAVHSRVAGTGFTLAAVPRVGQAYGIYTFHCTGG